MAAVEQPVATPKEQAHTVAEHLRAKDAGALDELRKDVRGMRPEEQQQFFRQLATEAKNSPNHNLPGLEITEDKKGGLQVKDKGGVLYNEGKSGKPEAPTAPAKPGGEQFSPGLKKGEGPYQALHRQHPDWNHKQLLDEAHKIKEQTGRKEFKAGEQFKSNPDGSVTTREESKKNDGSFTETNSKDGHKTSVRTGDKDGNWTENKFDPSGKSTGSVEHKV
ncbi:MAG: hypothetical protein K2X81_21780, partial [Candidatus Obscuribacterales bacterium]|nr:hypothetical protein [Candidatus Obscuribacterales bacterium]